jgi:glycosyltransferase involved in cell wall biosynthesis
VDLVLEQPLGPVPGGTGRYAVEVGRALAATAPPGSTVRGWTAWHRDLGPARVAGVRPLRRLPLPRRALTLAWERGLPLRPRGDLLHAPTLLAPPRSGRPLVVTVHDAVPWTHPETLTPRGVRWHRAMAGRVLAEADALVVPSRAAAEQLARHLDLPGRVVVAGAGVSGRLAVGPDAEARRAAMGLASGEYLLTIATLEPRKGLDVLLEALGRVPGELPPLVVVGQAGWGGLDPLATAAAHGVPAGGVRLLGRLSDADLAAALDGAAALVAPSRAEGFGLPVLEAMAAGVPVVSSDDAALVEVGGGATRTSPVGDPDRLAEELALVMGDRDLRSRLRSAGLVRAADFSWEAVATRLWGLYRDVLDGV